MKTAAETPSPTRVKLTVEVPYDEPQAEHRRGLRRDRVADLGPRFRKGKVPARIIDQRVGRGAVLQEAINEALPNFYGQAVEEAEVRPIGQPEVEVTAVPMDDSEPLASPPRSTSAQRSPCPTRHHRRLPSMTSWSPTRTSPSASTSCRTRFGTLVPVERAAWLGRLVSIDLAATIGEESIDEVAGISTRSAAAICLIGLDEALTGLSAGESATFTAPLAGATTRARTPSARSRSSRSGARAAGAQ